MEELTTVRKLIDTYFGLIFKVGIIGVLLSTLFLFSNLTTEFYDTPKFIILLVFTGVLLILLTLKFTITGKVIFTRTPLDIPLLLLLAVGIVSTVLSPVSNVAVLGNQLKIHGSLISIVVYILFYFVVVNSLKDVKETKWLLNLAVIFSQVLALVTLFSYIGIKLLPAPWVMGPNFTPSGSSFSTAAILAMLLPFVLRGILKSTKPVLILLYSLSLTLSALTIALTGSWASWIAGLAALVLTLWISGFGKLSNLKALKPISLTLLTAPLVIVVLVAILSLIPPLGSAQNPLYQKAQDFPREIQLGLIDSWKVSISAFRDLPFWGSGPSTFLFDFTNYKPVEFNASKLWNLRFDLAFNEYLQTLATLGAVGLIALLSATALFISAASRLLSTREEPQDSGAQLQLPLAVSGIIFFILLALHASTLALWVTGLFIIASFMKAKLSDASRNWAASDIKTTLFKIASNVTSQSSSQEVRVDALPGILLTVALILVGMSGYFGVKYVLADYHHRLALNAVAANLGVVAYNELVTAEKLNPYSDLYRTDLAQTNFALANAIAVAKGPTEASPAGSLTDQDKQNIQVLLQQSINEARVATTLNPKSATNWEILALLYRQISGVAQNALVFSLDSYGRAIFQDPLNPALRVSVGGVYYAVKSYDMAIRFFTDAINLKPDYANAYYNLSVTLKDKGDLANAQAMAEKTLTLIDAKSADYKPLSDYINELKSKTAAQAALSQQPPAAQAEGALQKQDLPKVVDVGTPPSKIATPEAIKKPAASPSPVASPAQASTPSAVPSANP